MLSKFAAAAALVGAAVAVPAEYKYNTPSPVAVVYETDVATIYSCPPEVTDCPVGRPATYSAPAPPAYTPTETPCEETTAPVYTTAEAVYSTPAGVYSAPTSSETEIEVYSTPAAVYSSEAAYYTPTPSAPATYVVCSTELVTVTSCAAYVTNCPADHTAVYTSLIPYSTTICESSEAASLSSYWVPYTQVVSTPIVYSTPVVALSTTCEETETLPVETGTYAVETTSYAVETETYAQGGTYETTVPVVYVPTAPYPTGPAVTYPAGGSTGTSAVSGYASGTGVASSYPPTFTGAASGVKAGLSLAGLGAVAALLI